MIEIVKTESEEPPQLNGKEWNDWKWQIKNSIVKSSENNLPMRVTPYYKILADKYPEIAKTVYPSDLELFKTVNESEDPLNEEGFSPCREIVHRYPNRVLFLVTSFCSNNCRYCTRSRIVGDEIKNDWERGLKYIREHEEINDVLISGGDPLTLEDSQLEYLLKELRKINHVEVIRIGSKVPVVLPMRITDNLVNILKKYHPLWMNIHFTHPEEFTEECCEAIRKLADAGIVLGSQTVLLKDINDDEKVLKTLFLKLVKNRIRPYYLYACDQIVGSSHFRVPVKKGIEIMKNIKGTIGGISVPNFVIDAPKGGGKITISPNCYEFDGKTINLINYEGKKFQYIEE